jgi:hypothetical protein
MLSSRLRLDSSFQSNVLLLSARRLKEALTLINQVDVSKFSMLLTRIIGRLATKVGL